MLFSIYMFFGILAFLYELSQGSGWKLATFVAFFYPVTLLIGVFGWLYLGLEYLGGLLLKALELIWLSKLFQMLRLGTRL